jgi:di/tricarboxylate transporter
MAVGASVGLPVFLTALMVGNGANAGNLSPLSAVGVIANERMRDAGLGGHEWKVFAANFLAHVLVAVVAYAFLARTLDARRGSGGLAEHDPMSRRHEVTLAIVAAWIAAVVFAGAPLGLAAFAASVLIIVSRAAEETAALKRMPWGAIIMVCGMTMLVTAAEKAGGLQLFTSLLAGLATPRTINGLIAFVTGVISTASSTSGVVLPTFLPMSPGLVTQVGGGDPLAVALSINVGSSVVDVSPLSTLGALCVTAVMDPDASRDLFRKLMVWGLSMTIVGALMCQLFAGAFARL